MCPSEIEMRCMPRLYVLTYHYIILEFQVARARPNVPILVEETPAMFEVCYLSV